MKYRCLHSKGHAVSLFNVSVEAESYLICGLAFFSVGIGDRVTLTDIDSGIKICSIKPPEELKETTTFLFLADPLDQIKIEIHEILALPSLPEAAH